MPKIHTSIRLDRDMIDLIDEVVSKKRPKSDRTRYIEEAVWKKLENDPDAKDLL